jgi:GntR family transcriptional regulator
MAAEPALFEINPNSGVPIYRQIVDQVLALTAGGTLRPGDLLPSVRQVARDAAVNPMTVSKAYSKLETEGVVRRVRGQGMEVLPPSQNGSLDDRLAKFRTTIEPALHRARQLGLTTDQIRESISSLLQEQMTCTIRRDESGSCKNGIVR